jgi:hypothetical protein
MVELFIVTLLLTLPPGWQHVGVTAVDASPADTCTRAGELRATTCRLPDNESIADTLDPGESATYRVDALTPNSRVDLLMTEAPDTTIAVVDWRGDEIDSATSGADAAEVNLAVTLTLPGAYGVRLSSDDSTSATHFRILATQAPSGPLPTVLWPRGQADDSDNLAGERQLIRTPRGGTPSGGVAIAKALGAPPAAEVGDFTLVADVRMDEISGPAGLTVRFRYEPEAGGGSGYLLTLDPFAGESYLDSFEEGRRRPVVGRTKLPVELADGTPRRQVLQTSGPYLVASLDGQAVLRATDTRYPGGLIAIGAVTWSDPIGVIFDHLLVLTPPAQP